MNPTHLLLHAIQGYGLMDVLVTMITHDTYSIHPKTNAILAFKIYPTKSVVLIYNKIYLIKEIVSTKKHYIGKFI